MKFQILGSGGGEGFPAPFCCCEHCETARQQGGKSLRTLSQSIINDDLLIDFPTDTAAHCLRFGVRLGKVQHVLITHAHEDHFIPYLLFFRGGVFAHEMAYEDIRFYGPSNLQAITDRMAIADEVRQHIHFVTLADKQTRRIGNYEVTALTARHAPQLGSLNYIIEQDGKRVWYLIDSGYPTDETIAYLKSRGEVFDLVVMDATMGVAPVGQYAYHMGYYENIQLKARLEREGLADARTRFVATHITHNLSEYHEKVEDIFKGTGIDVAYDGMELLV